MNTWMRFMVTELGNMYTDKNNQKWFEFNSVLESIGYDETAAKRLIMTSQCTYINGYLLINPEAVFTLLKEKERRANNVLSIMKELEKQSK